VVVHIGTTVL